MPKMWKYVIPSKIWKGAIELPHGAQIGRVDAQHGQIVFWAYVDSSAPLERRVFETCLTGTLAPDGKYLGTAVFDEGRFVLHLFEVDAKPC